MTEQDINKIQEENLFPLVVRLNELFPFSYGSSDDYKEFMQAFPNAIIKYGIDWHGFSSKGLDWYVFDKYRPIRATHCDIHLYTTVPEEDQVRWGLANGKYCMKYFTKVLDLKTSETGFRGQFRPKMIEETDSEYIIHGSTLGYDSDGRAVIRVNKQTLNAKFEVIEAYSNFTI